MEHTEQERVTVSTGRSKDDDEGDGPLQTETSKGGVERSIAREELGEGEDTFSTKLLVDSSLPEEDGEDVSDGGERDDDGNGGVRFGSEPGRNKKMSC